MHEDLLRHIWLKRLFDSSQLKTVEGRSVHILESGTLHRGAGPDFRNAVIRIDGTIFHGDIEFHRTIQEWISHHHHTDPAYNSVILHVVLQGKADHTASLSGRIIPTIILEPFLHSSIEHLSDQLSREEFFSRRNEIPCESANGNIDSALVHSMVHTLYQERLQSKVARLHDRLCGIILRQQHTVKEPQISYHEMIDDIPLPDSSIDKNLFKQKLSWEQLLYEEMMDAFGYSNNREPMRKLAENVSLANIISIFQSSECIPLELQAILFKASGLLPRINELTDQVSKVFVHQLHSAWNNLPSKIPVIPLHSAEWNFSPTRPSNFPTIRIAAASAIVHKVLHQSLFKSIIMIAGGKYSSAQSKIDQLVSILDAGDDQFWNYHYSFTEATHKKHSLIGTPRKHDIIINTLVPFICLYAKVFGKGNLAEHCLSLAVELPLLEDNSILRIMNKHLIKGKLTIQYGFQQQALIQLYKNYCIKERCSECEAGKAVFK